LLASTVLVVQVSFTEKKFCIQAQNCLKHFDKLNSLAAGLWYIRTSISALKTAVFSCITNALAPPPIALQSCSMA